ncbi:MAG: hypothetical protein KJO06_05945 [Gemmatimonadetes bacterium]|nr:hypothetical protein [Gemmatimonadota bacterium]NNK49598.1 hypothetical protein [Gemmatimonadota bacterium]
MEVRVLLKGPDTVHPVVVSVPDGEDPSQRLASAIAQNAAVFSIGTSTFRTDLVLAVTIQDPSMRTSW